MAESICKCKIYFKERLKSLFLSSRIIYCKLTLEWKSNLKYLAHDMDI